MCTLPLHTLASLGHSLNRVASDWESRSELSADIQLVVRSMQKQDLVDLAEVLASSFHPQEGWWGWFYPLMRMGIREDMRGRFYSKDPHQVCLVAVAQGSCSVNASLPAPLNASANAPVNAFVKAAIQSQGSTLGQSQEAFQRSGLLEEKGDRCLEQLVGTIELSLRTAAWYDRPTRYLYLSNLAVQREYRQQGVARQLVQACEQIAANWGFPDLYLHVLENNQPARRLYSKAGYRLHRTETSVRHWLLGQPKELFLRKQLGRGKDGW